MSFLGFYYKINDAKNNIHLIIVAGYHKKNNKKSGFVQFNYSESHESSFKTITFYDKVIAYGDQFIQIGSSKFSNESILIKTSTLQLELKLKSKIPYPNTRFGKNIMGALGLVPFVECKHRIVSIHSEATGSIKIGSKVNFLNQSQVYIECSFGKQFPESFFWTHFNQFENKPDTHFLLALANPEWLYKKRNVHVGYLLTDDEFYSFGNYHQFKLLNYKFKDKSIDFKFTGKHSEILININFGEDHIKLIAPEKNGMSREINEFTNSSTQIVIKKKGIKPMILKGVSGTTENEMAKL